MHLYISLTKSNRVSYTVICNSATAATTKLIEY